jgi:hypothetical protein
MKKPLILFLFPCPVALSFLKVTRAISHRSLQRVFEIRAGYFEASTANLLVVILLVTPYKPKRGESREILPRSRYQGTGASEEA